MAKREEVIRIQKELIAKGYGRAFRVFVGCVEYVAWASPNFADSWEISTFNHDTDTVSYETFTSLDAMVTGMEKIFPLDKWQ
jgi:hypothetical protein